MTIQDDIMRAARDAAHRFLGMAPCYPEQFQLQDAIAKAIAAERERCAKVAEAFAKSLPKPPSCRPDDEIEAWNGKQIACIFIAATIRNGEQP